MRCLFVLFLLIFTSLQAAQKPLEKVSLQLQWLDQFQFAGYYIAKEKGFYKNLGLDVEIKKFSHNINTVKEVVSSRSTYGIGRSTLVKNHADGEPIQLISAIFQSSPHIMIALKSSNISTIDDFKDKTIMLTNDVIQAVGLYAMIYSSSVNIASIKFKKHTLNVNELINGNVDLYSAYTSNEPYVLRQKNIDFITFSPKDKGLDFYSDILFTSLKEAHTNPKRVEKFKEASLMGWEYAFENIDEAVDIIYNKYNKQNKTKQALLFEAQELKKLAYANNAKLGDINKERVAQIIDIYKIMGLTKKDIDMHELIFHSSHIHLTQDEQNYLSEKKSISICVAPNSLPYSAIEDGKFIGIGAGVVELAQDIIKAPFELVDSKTWQDAVQNAIKRKCDILPLAAKTPLREKYFNFTTPYYLEPLVIVTKKTQNYILDINSILDKELSIVKGNSFIENLRLKYPNIKLNIVNSMKDALIGVEDGKYYGHIDIMMSSAYALQKMSKIDLKISGQFPDKVKVSFAVRNDDKKLFNIFEKISKNIHSSDIQNILNKWVSVNYTQNVNFKYLWETLFFTSVMLGTLYYRQRFLRKRNKELKTLQDELLELNQSLESRIQDSVKEIQEKDTYLLHRSRLAQMGEVMSMVAHQWKQPLNSISAIQISLIMAIELKQYDLDDKQQQKDFLTFLKDKLNKIGAHTKSLSHIIADFSDFYKPSREADSYSPDEVIFKAYRLIQASVDSSDIAVSLNLNANSVIKIYANEFMQVILSIVNNSKEQLEQNNIKHPKIEIYSYETNDSIFIEISDNAGGIKDDIIEKIFEPYYSTKLEKNGTGLGLHMSKSIIEQHHNGIIYAKNKNDGAAFIIQLQK